MKELYRIKAKGIFLGVCAGLGEYFEIDANFVRIIFIVMSFAGGASFLLYFALAIIMPSDDNKPLDIKEGVNNLRKYFNQQAETVKSTIQENPINVSGEPKNTFGLIIALIGLFILLYNLNILSALTYVFLWPMFLIIVGLTIFFNKKIDLNIFIFILVLLLFLSVLFHLFHFI